MGEEVNLEMNKKKKKEIVVYLGGDIKGCFFYQIRLKSGV